MLHRRDIIVRDICKSNVVRVKTGGALTWTLLEFGSVTRPGAMAQSVTAQTAPPEVRLPCLRSLASALALDMRGSGLCVSTGEPIVRF